MNPFETKKFKKLKAVWDKRLLKSGFEDIENSDGSLKATTDTRTIRNALVDQTERETYYSIAVEFLNAHEFSDMIEREIWKEHCDGIGRLSIAKKLNLTFYRVNLIITKLQKLAKLRKK